MLLAGVKLFDKEQAERLEKEDKKHRKKEKRKKRKKHSQDKKRDRAGDASDSGSDEPGREAAAAPRGGDAQLSRDPVPADAQPAAAREDWMTVPMPRAAPPAGAAAQQPADAPKPKAVELNPHFRDGGDGLPPAAPAAPAPGRPPAGAVGDGGASWRMKALRRAQTQAAEQGKGLSEIVADRWGSVGELTAGLSERRPAPAMAHAHAARDRRGGEDRRPRRPDPRDGEEGEDKAERPQQRRQERGGEERRGGERAGYLEDLRSARSQMRRPSGDEARTGGAATASRRDDRGGERGRGRGRDPLGRRADAEALRAAAGEINAFSADGSFMEQFLEGQRGGGGAAAAGDAAQEPAAEQQQQQQQQRSPASDGGDAAPPARRSPAPSTAQQVEAPRPSAASAPAAAAGGNMSVAAALRARLSGRAPPAAAAHPPAGPPSAAARRQHEQHQEHEHVALPLIDAQGRAAPGAFGREAAGAKESGVRPARRVERYDGGEKRRYYADDDAADLATLVKRTKYEGVADIDANLARNIARAPRYRATDMDADAEYDHDGGLELADGGRRASKAARRRGDGGEEAAQRDKARQVREFGRLTSALDKCARCFASAARPRHLALAIGTAAYLALPPRGRLVPGHCQIVPTEHAASTRGVDEAAWTEVRNFKKCLIRMHAAAGLECVFVETALRLGDARSHAVVDCVPLPPEAAARAPMYFRKAVDDATSEWAQHHAKRFVDTAAKGLRGAIPPNFPYLNVEFGLGAGFVHVVDDEERFDASLARGVLIGLLGLPQEDMHRRAKQESAATQAQWAAEFRRQFDEFDWTKALQ